ncbi:hypothetical protein NW066_00755 [Mycoplasmopsis felis]|nr:DNA gyrase subunit A [Mycoplasmopsis felis]UWV85266.1 hypothetical protein NW066_00755 [Mycoplasmopsis felis]
MRYPLVDGHGNFGSIDGDQAAAMRYTEVRMSKLSAEMIEGIKKETVDFVDNYDRQWKRTCCFTIKISELISFRFFRNCSWYTTTEIPPHNLGEVIDATILLAKKPNSTIKELMEHLKGYRLSYWWNHFRK